jgi:hypothetical protein
MLGLLSGLAARRSEWRRAGLKKAPPQHRALARRIRGALLRRERGAL